MTVSLVDGEVPDDRKVVVEENADTLVVEVRNVDGVFEPVILAGEADAVVSPELGETDVVSGSNVVEAEFVFAVEVVGAEVCCSRGRINKDRS